MGTPAKKRKLNSDSKASPATSRSLDYFFGKQKQDPPKAVSNAEQAIDHNCDISDLTDEQLARKLQAEWDQEDDATKEMQENTKADATEIHAELADLPERSKHTPASEGADGEAQEPYEQPNDTKATPFVFGAKGKNTLSLQSAGTAEDTICSNITFDESPLTFDPSKYIKDLQGHWAAEGGDASYALLTRCFVLVNSTQSRIKIVDTLVNLLRVIIEGDPSSLLPTVWLSTNAISPPYISLELGLGGSAISKALKNVCGLDNKSLKALYDKVGDAGDVAFEAKKKQSFTLRKPKPLSIKGVYQSLVKIANTQGTGSGEIKQRVVDRLLQDARGAEESRYIVRTLCQHLRIGAVKTTMLIALSRAFLLSRPPGADFSLRNPQELAKLKKENLVEVWSKAEEIVKACFAKRPNYNDLIPIMLEIGVCDELLIRCGLALHIPLRPMLGSITRDLSEMLTKLQGRDFSCEYKYDGQRAQVHCDDQGKVTIFSRHLELMTDKYPDLVALIPKIRGEGVSSFIMEGEVVAVDQNTGDLKTFQTLANRARKDVVIGSVKIDVCLFSFDLMYLNGESLLDRPFRERRELLRGLFTEVPNQFTWVKSIDATSQDSETVLEFFKSATDIKCEGIMVKILDNLPNPNLQSEVIEENDSAAPEAAPPPPTKTTTKGKKKSAKDDPSPAEKKTRRKPLLATYEPDKRLDSWLKVKKDYSTTFDTLDLIPVAGWHGQGRKAAWWSPILLACRNPESGSLEAVCKCISGFTDSFYKANKEFYSQDGPNTLGSKPRYVEYTGGHPDVWFEPQEVWEMAFADITISPTYTAAIGLVSEDRGLSLRFPRFLKKRDDKGIEEASTNDFLAGLWRKQEEKAPGPGKEVQDEGDEDE
ncbi:DNA ligase-like protein I [Mollisia scopiformis]|uniref:DNA ligase n=1 Tax=Mollisia scopiformis TaxID=149040 RepID=A0A194X496_MOLSC|nr:DNA ligase-like protein I [Mollisia scopiformis]KUJ14647.1 DNA ligase-like protein I [Mollisia scopiformis]